MSSIVYKLRITGRVQGVGFRYNTQQKARTVGITGYAHNLPDGSVEVLLCGSVDQVENVLAWFNTGGPPHARIDAIQRKPYWFTEPLTDFTIA